MSKNKKLSLSPQRGDIGGVSKEELEELRYLIDELDLVPLSVYPRELRPLVLDYLRSLENVDELFDHPIERESINIYLRKHRKRKKPLSFLDLKLFNC